MTRAARYSWRHLSRSGFRAMLPAFVIAIGAMLIFTVQTLTAVVDAQAHLVVSDVGEEAVSQVVRASWIISIVSLVLGGFETAIIMSRAVFARRREIGVLRAAGIGDRPIFSVFLFQSALYGAIGGAIGIAIGVAAIALFGVVSPDVVDLATSVVRVPPAAATAFGLSLVIAVFAGIVPAYRATRMPAIQAIYAVW
jgi:ABC-type antimicrobial peptide transport system permease subunit